MKPRVQVICGQPLPFGNVPTTGAGLRAWSLGEGLAARGCEVIYSLPYDVVDRFPETYASLRSSAFEYKALDQAIERVNPSVVVLQGWTWANLLTERPDLPIAMDLTGPYLVESLFSRVEDQSMMHFRKLQALQKADFITCAGWVQRHYFLPWLLLAGHDIREQACPAIPMSLSPDPPRSHPPDEPTFLYGGIFLPWQDASHVLDRLMKKLDARKKGRLVIFAGPHPTYLFPTGAMPKIIEALRSHPRVEFAGVVPYETLVARSTQCTVSVDLMKRNVERELAFTTRTVVALWCGLPVLYNNYSELSTHIQAYRAGWTVDPEDQAGIDNAIDFVFDHPDQVRAFGRHAQQLVKERLNWETTVDPLAAFCHTPSKREHGQSLLDQAITPVDDRICQLFIKTRNSPLYQGLKRLKGRK